MPTLIENPTLRDNIDQCRKLGLRFIELNMNFPEYQIDKLDARMIKRAASDSDIFFTIHLDENLDPAAFNPLVREAYLETVRRTICLAKEIHAPVINMHMNHGIRVTLPDRKVQLYERDKDVYLMNMKRFADLVERETCGTDIRVTVENTDGFKSFEKEAIGLLLEKKAFALTWDIGHSVTAGEKDKSFFTEHASRLIHMHVHDGRFETRENHLALGDGEIDLADRLATAQKNHCRCVLETKTAAALTSSVRWLTERGYMEET